MSERRIELWVWPTGDGGWSRVWITPDDLPVLGPQKMGFFVFGRFGGGWSPFGGKFASREETQLAAERAVEKFGLPVDVYFDQGPPPEGMRENPAAVKVYHGTTWSSADAALKNGFRELKSKKLFVTDSLAVATAYAAFKAAVWDEPYGAVLALDVDQRFLVPDEFAYLFLCANEQDVVVLTLAQLRKQKACLQVPATGAISLREVGSAVYLHSVPSSSVTLVQKVHAATDDGALKVKDARRRVRLVHRFVL